LSRLHVFAGLLAISLAAGCKAQPAPQTPANFSLDRHIEVMVRSQYNIPQDYDVQLGARKPSQIPGYDALPVTLVHGANKTPIDFLISTDNKTLARLETFDLAKDPLFNISVEGRPVRGNPAAKVTIVNFDDLACPYCARMHAELFPAALDRYKDKIRVIYKDNPLIDLHPWAMHASVDANCLAAQDGPTYWSFVDYVHNHGQEINGEDRNLAKSFDALNRIARQQAMLAKLDLSKLDSCMAAQDETAVRASMSLAESLRLEGAPALFIDGERVYGAVPEKLLWQVVDRALRAAGIEPPPPPAPQPQTAQLPPSAAK
jgi:protein-disulfide isomerase